MRIIFTRDRIVGLTVIVVAAVISIICFTEIPPSKLAGDVGSRAFPLLAAATMTLCGLMLVFRRNQKKTVPFLLPGQWKRLAGILLLYLLYYLALNFLGFLAATPIFLFVLCTILAKAAQKTVSVAKKVIFSLFTTAAVYGVFQMALHVTLPKGIFQ